MALAVPFVVGLWMHYRGLRRDEHPGLADRRGTLLEIGMLAALVAILAAGLYATTIVGARWSENPEPAFGRASLAAASVNPALVAVSDATPARGHCRLQPSAPQLVLMEGASKDIRRLYLIASKRGRSS